MAKGKTARAANGGVDLDPSDIEHFGAGLRGKLLGPQDEGYDEARKVYNGMIDRRPRLIAKCVDVSDVISSVNFARENELTLSVRGGSHNVTGFAVCDDGLVVDLSNMKGVRIDPNKKIGRVEGGCTWGDMDHAGHAFGLATPGGILSTTGCAGLTLGGRNRPPDTKVRPLVRQFDLGRCCDRRWQFCHGKRQTERGSFLGAPWRWR